MFGVAGRGVQLSECFSVRCNLDVSPAGPLLTQVKLSRRGFRRHISDTFWAFFMGTNRQTGRSEVNSISVSLKDERNV